MATVPSGPLTPLSARIADNLLRPSVNHLPLRLRYADGTVLGAAAPTMPTLVLHQPDQLARRVGTNVLIGFGASYMAGQWTPPIWRVC
ncbi:MAG: hypothetical protein ACSLE6_12115 [Mycobacterium sp.]